MTVPFEKKKILGINEKKMLKGSEIKNKLDTTP